MELPRYKCLRCYHEWIPRSNEKPVRCPYCKSPYWDKERKVWKSYVQVLKPDHPRADSNGTVHRSVLVLERKLGRFLEPLEEPHHTNGIITDDRPENLELTTHSEHAKKHGFYEYNHNTRYTKGRPFYGNGFVNADGTRKLAQLKGAGDARRGQGAAIRKGNDMTE